MWRQPEQCAAAPNCPYRGAEAVGVDRATGIDDEAVQFLTDHADRVRRVVFGATDPGHPRGLWQTRAYGCAELDRRAAEPERVSGRVACGLLGHGVVSVP